MTSGKRGLKTEWSIEERLFPKLTHYYGDAARELMLSAVVLLIFAAPFYADSLATEFPLEIVGAVLIVAFAALTNPFKRSIVMADTVLTGAGAAIFAAWAFLGYGHVDSIAFLLRDLIALVFLFAFYFSLKTLRAMLMHQVGKPDSMLEFRRTMPPATQETLIEEEVISEQPKADPLSYEKEAADRFFHENRTD